MKKINEIEKYKNVKDHYWVDRKGDVYSSAKGGWRKLAIKITKPTKSGKGGGNYRSVCLVTEGGKCIYPKVCRLVALAFIPNPDNLPQVDHFDKNSLNDNVENLRWLSARDNTRHSKAKKLYCYSVNGLEKIYESGVDVKEDGYNPGHALAVARGVELKHKQRYFSFVELEDTTEIIQRLSKPPGYRGSRRRE